ncbi:Rhodanese- sulfurtransferase [Agyrium rufum]|nr:Rhodanese- sulfurtransferase [Agyrium rufum]
MEMSVDSTPAVDDKSVTVTKPIPYTFDLGNLLCNDANPIPPKPTDVYLATNARDCAQGLINQLLLTCPINSHPTDGVLLTLPTPTTPLPREKHLPAPKQETKWERFARKKGIKDKKRGEGKMVYDEEKGDWVPKWGYKGRKQQGGLDEDWIVEVDEKKEKKAEEEGRTVRSLGRKDRMDKIRRNERAQRANERKGRKSGGGL